VDNYLAIMADIKAKLLSVENVGVVHDYERQASTESKFLELFTIPGPDHKKSVLGWELTRASARETKRGSTFFRHHRFVAKGYMGLQDAIETDKLFQVLIEKIAAKFRTAEPAGGDADHWYYMDGLNPNNSCVQADQIDQRMFGGVLCHHADVYITITEQIIA